MNGLAELSPLVAALGGARFGAALMDYLGRRLAVSQVTAFEMPFGGPPAHLLADGASDGERQEARRLSERYRSEGYERDPYLRRIRDCGTRLALPSVSLDLRDPMNCENPAFHQTYYLEPGLQEEIAMSHMRGDRLLYVGLYRSRGQRAFDGDDMAAIHNFSPLLMEMIGKHFELEAAHGKMRPCAPPEVSAQERRSALMQRVADALQRDAGRLTERESEVCARIVVGYTTTGIARCLEISENTVATHRKRAYAKLGISAQSELFGRYVHLVAQ